MRVIPIGSVFGNNDASILVLEIVYFILIIKLNSIEKSRCQCLPMSQKLTAINTITKAIDNKITSNG